jgi:hypothetical protein
MAEFEQKREQLLALLDRNSGTIVTAFIQNQPVAVTEE